MKRSLFGRSFLDVVLGALGLITERRAQALVEAAQLEGYRQCHENYRELERLKAKAATRRKRAPLRVIDGGRS